MNPKRTQILATIAIVLIGVAVLLGWGWFAFVTHIPYAPAMRRAS